MTQSTALGRLGKFISFEGIDGAGKSSHIDSVVAWLQAQGLQVVSTREPGGTQLGEQLRQLLLHTAMHVETEALLMFAARREHLAQVIEPALQQGKWVVSDRFTDATFAYQGGGRKVPLAKLETLEQWVHPHRQPDLTFLFDLPLEVARARIASERTLDKFEQEQADFFNATRNEYLRRATQHAARFRIIDASRSLPEVAQDVATALQAFCQDSQA
jgi:dTMP kinase